MWWRHWGLIDDPFRPLATRYVPTPTHEEAVARLVHLIGSSSRRIDLTGAAGLGKSIVLREGLRRLGEPMPRRILAHRPPDLATLLRSVGEGFGLRPGASTAPSAMLAALRDRARLERLQGRALVIAVDDDRFLDSDDDRRWLGRLEWLDADPSARCSLIVAGRRRRDEGDPWDLAIRLSPLGRSAAAAYLEAKLGDAGAEAPHFSDAAITRLHAVAGGVPAAIDRLAGLAMRAGASGGMRMIDAAVIDDVALECRAPDLARLP